MPDEKTKKAYHVVREENGAWRSAVIDGAACVTYVLGERSYGFEGTPVTVFLSKRAAWAWRRGWPGQALLKGTAGNPRPQACLAALWWGGGDASLWRLRQFWVRGAAYRGECFDSPSGTHAADWFEPDEEVGR